MGKTKGQSVKVQMLAAFLVIIAFLLVVSAVSIGKLISTDHVIETTSELMSVEHSKTKAIEKTLTACDDITFNLQDDPSRYSGDGAS
jgi:flagellar basal body-associated protein FliL